MFHVTWMLLEKLEMITVRQCDNVKVSNCRGLILEVKIKNGFNLMEEA